MKEFKIYVSGNREIRAALIAMVEKKSGSKHLPSQDCGGGTWLKNDSDGLWVGGPTSGRDEITIADLEAMPDYALAKEMTLPEIIKELGYEVKIVK